MLIDKDRIDFNKFFKIQSSNRTRGHNCRIIKQRSHLDIRKYFFSQRVVNTWNSLPQAVIDADSINSFKNRLDQFNNYFIFILFIYFNMYYLLLFNLFYFIYYIFIYLLLYHLLILFLFTFILFL